MFPDIKILLVEDDSQLGDGLLRSLHQAGYHATWVQTAKDGLYHLSTKAYAIVLLDLGLPDSSGVSVLRKLRSGDDRTPVLVLTARDGVQDRVIGLDEGADDYLIKPFAVPELFSRINALLRRSAGFAAKKWVIGDLVIEPAKRIATMEGRLLELGPREYRIIFTLARFAGAVVSRATLEEAAFEMGCEPESNSIDVHVHRLRRKLGQDYIRTIRGIGYLLDKP